MSVAWAMSRNLQNRSPSRIFDRLLGPGDTDPPTGMRSAPNQYQALYEAAASTAAVAGLPDRIEQLAPVHRVALRAALRARTWPAVARAPYAELCQEVSTRTAAHWSARIATPYQAEALMWRLLRILSAPYFILGSDPRQALRLRIDTPLGLAPAFPAPPPQPLPCAGRPTAGDVDCGMHRACHRPYQGRRRPCGDPLEPRPLRPDPGGQGVPRHSS